MTYLFTLEAIVSIGGRWFSFLEILLRLKGYVFLGLLFLKEMLNLLTSKFRFSSSDPSPLSSSLSSLDGILVFNAKPFFSYL